MRVNTQEDIMSNTRTIGLSNALISTPRFEITAIGLNAVQFTVADGTGNEVTLRIPRAEAKKIGSNTNGVVGAQEFQELELLEAAGTITDAQVKSLARRRETRERSADAVARRAAAAKADKASGKANLKAVA
jgi:hypothetical protein